MRFPSPPPRVLAILALTLAVVAFPLGALASHDFADVPDSNLFHADISALVASGVTSGCGGGNYCPSANVTREQMAAFLNRLGALAPGKTPVVNATKLDGLDSTQFLRSDQTQHYSCMGTDMAPLDSSTTYRSDVLLAPGSRYIVSGDDYLTCAVHLPDGATVTGFSSSVSDTVATDETTCSLSRVNAADGLENLATVSSGVVAAAGYNTVVDSTIDNPTIDNATYAYTAWCFMPSGKNGGLLVVKVTVTYTGAP